MKKQMLQKVFLILLPTLATGLATTKDSVTVADQLTGVTGYYSYFDLIPATNMQILPPLAAVLCLLTAALAVVYVVAKKEGCLQAIKVTTFGAMLAAVGPILLRGDILVIPHVGLPLIMAVEYGLVWFMLRPENKVEEKGSENRLGKH